MWEDMSCSKGADEGGGVSGLVTSAKQEPVAVGQGFAEWLDPWGGEYQERQ